MMLKTSTAGVLLVVAGAIAATGFMSKRLAPESSPIARGAAHAATHRCADSSCRGELRGLKNQCDDLAFSISCEDVSTYWIATRLAREMPLRLRQAPHNPWLQGERLARERHCFRCHGELGQGGLVNTGALTGYVPGYFGRDFRNLTEGGKPEIVREWITTGTSHNLTNHPITGFIAKFFLERQAVSMPKFSTLPSGEIDLLVDYVIAMNSLGALDAEGLERYALYSSSPTSGTFSTIRLNTAN